ncbi:LptE family protein [bacterium]|nr:LptE family protein [bacterium]
MRKNLSLVFLFLISCCGYSTSSLLPSYLKTIYISQIENKTLQPLLAERLFDELVSGFTQSGRLRVSPDASADLVLKIEITAYKKTASVFDASRNVLKWNYSINYTADCKDMIKNSNLWGGGYSVNKDYEAGLDEQEALNRLLKLVREDIIRNTLIAW